MSHYRKSKKSVAVATPTQKPEPLLKRGLRVREVSDYTSATVCMIRAAIKSGDLRAMMLGKRHIVLREDADRWLESLRAKKRVAA